MADQEFSGGFEVTVAVLVADLLIVADFKIACASAGVSKDLVAD